MEINFKNLSSAMLLRISRAHIINYATLALLGLFFVLTAIDAVIFISYYKIAVEPSRQSSFAGERLEISRQNLDKALDIIKKREAAF